ncbi:S-layer homology domain-containing protein [Paenibacillus sp. YN15]|uniref:S-layer homology domain-containing protein n=1 Tax=Paenibacillus sp. YN15 TaxID=1742774 RepID=UPI0015EBA77D|nr:S-layer homology domain-containing protein [Paenibacillus sp. YN15]
MSRKWIALLLALVLLAGLAPVRPGAAHGEAVRTNLFENGGFEEVRTGAAIWTGGVAPANASEWKADGNPVFSVVEDVYHTGSRSVRISGSTPGKDRGAVVLETQSMQVGKAYLVSGWFKTDNVTSNILIRLQYKRGGKGINVELANTGGTKDWTYFSRSIVLPDNTDNPSAPAVKVEAFLERSAGTVWFDDFSIAEHIPLESFTVSPAYAELQPGQSLQTEARFVPSDAANQNLAWTSSDPVTAAVYQDGRIAAIAPGYAYVTATSLETKASQTIIVSVGAPETLLAAPYSGTVQENGVLTGQLSAEELNGAPVEYGLGLEPKHGTVAIQPDGTFLYYPERDFSGTDQFAYMARTGGGIPKFAAATVTVEPVLKAPALDLLWYSTPKDKPLQGRLEKVLSPAPEAVEWEKNAEPQGQLLLSPDGAFQYTPPPQFVGYDSFRVKAKADNGLETEGRVEVFVIPDAADFANAMTANGYDGVHPRLFANEEEFARIRGWIGEDRYMSEWFGLLKTVADSMLDTEPYPYLANGANNGKIKDIVLNTALMYKLTGEQKYADRAIAELESAAAFEDWGGRYNNMLALTYLTMGAAIGYDWLYDALTGEQRAMIEAAVSRNSFATALEWYNGVFTHNGEYNNINLVDNGSFSVAALAFLGEASSIHQQAGDILQGSFRKLQQSLRFMTEDGSWPEGPIYWQFGTEPLYHMMDALQNILGTDYGLSALQGMKEWGDYPLYLQGPEGFFNFGDSGNTLAHPQSLWSANRYDDPGLAWNMGENYRRYGAYSPYYFFYYRPGMFDSPPQSGLDRTFQTIEAITMRSGWTSRNDSYAAMKGSNDTLLSHIDMDAGSFVYDALGVRWAMDLGLENYNLPGFWDSAGGQRWTYYRKGAQGQNTVVINPLDNPVHMQKFDAPALLVKSESKPRGAYGILDMASRYPRDTAAYQRGMMLDRENNQLILQDEMTLKFPSDVYWFMHTASSISILDNGKTALLRQGDKKLYVRMIDAPEQAEFLSMKAEALPGTPNPDGQTLNHGIRKLAVHMADVTEARLSVWMVPLNEEDPLPLQAPQATPLSGWTIPKGALTEKPAPLALDFLLVNGTPLADFHPEETYYEYLVPFNTPDIPAVEAVTGHAASVVPAQTIPGKTYIDVSDPANPARKTRYTVSFIRGPIVGDPPDVNRWEAAAVEADSTPQADQGFTPDKTVDRDLNTRWTSEGAHWIQYDLGTERELGAVSIAFISGDVRRAYFSIEASPDGINWTSVYPEGISSGTTTQPELVHFPSVQARYVRINGYGNSASRWNSIGEVGIFRTTPVSLLLQPTAQWKVGEEKLVTVQYLYPDGRQEPTSRAQITSSSPDILEIGEAGMAAAKKAGVAVVTVTDPVYGLASSWQIAVAPAQSGEDGNHDDDEDTAGDSGDSGNAGTGNSLPPGGSGNGRQTDAIQTVTPEEILSLPSKNGVLEVALSKDKHILHLPAASIDKAEGLGIAVAVGLSRVQLSAEALREIREQLPPDGIFALEAAQLEAAAAASDVSRTAAELKAALRLSADPLQLGFKLLDAAAASGTELLLPGAAGTAALSFPAPEASPTGQWGIYKLDEHGFFRLIGGQTAGNGQLSVPVADGGVYALLEYVKAYRDLPQNHWAYATVQNMSMRGIIAGTADDAFEPERPITRSEFAALIARALGLHAEDGAEDFSDVPSDAWYAPAVAALAKAGIVEGNAAAFEPARPISREEMAAMMSRTYSILQSGASGTETGENPALPAYADLGSVSDWAAEAVQKASELGLMNGLDGGLFRPQASATRAEGATVVSRLLGLAGR